MKKKLDASALVGKHVRSLALGKQHYARADAALAVLVKTMSPGQTVTLAGGRTFELIDEFADELTVFKPCGVRRYSLKEVPQP